MRKILLLLSCLALGWSALAQQTVTGKVTDATDGSALPGVSILVKGTTKGTVSDTNGNYRVEAAPTDVLVFSFIGFSIEEIMVAGQTSINVPMKISAKELQEIVVIGYGEREKKDVTGAISSMDSKDIIKSTSMTPELAMQGRMAGVFVSTPSGNPFDRPNVQIRGVATFGYSSPLYVIDGIPVIEGGASNGNAGIQDIRSPINIMASINPNDIESISVLKDASSAAIYGVRASNGVILITTKKGKSGKPKVEFSMSSGIQNVAKKFDMLQMSDYVKLYTEAYANNPVEAGNVPSELKPSDPAYLGNTVNPDNWQDALLNKNAGIKDYSLRVSGGNDATTYFISTGYGKTEGSLIQNSLERFSLASNVTSKISKYIETGLNLRLSQNRAVDNTGTDLAYVAGASPWQPIYDANDVTGFAPSVTATFSDNPDFDLDLVNPGPKFNMDATNYLWGPGTRSNPFATQSLNERTFGLFRSMGSAYLQIEPIKGLKFKGTVSADYYFNLKKEWGNYDSYRFSQTPGNPFSGHDGTAKGSYGERQNRNFNLIKEFSINYAKSIGNHSIDVLFSAMDQEQTWRFTDGSSGQINTTDPAQRNVGNNPPFNGAFTGFIPQNLQGYLGRVSYKFSDRYYLDATLRRDGSSVFAPDYRWGTFPSVSGAWRLSAEPFFQNLGINFVDDLKFRGGWGELGNKETTQGFAYLSTINTSPDYSFGSGSGNPFGTQKLGARLPNYPNRELSWERVRTTNIGFDATLLDTHVTFTAEYYTRFTKGIIQGVSLPPNTGIEAQTDLNIGSVKNNGIELQLGYNNRIGDFAFNISGNLTTVKNRVTELYQGTPIFAAGGRVEEGFPIGYIFGYQSAGIFQNAQEVTDWKGVNEDGVGTNDQQPGDIYFSDLRGNPETGEVYNNVRDSLINNNDQIYLGKTIPGFYYGVNLGGSYKGLDFSIFFQGVGDIQKYNWARAGGENMSAQTINNQWTTTNGRWTTENPSSTMPRAVISDPNSNNRFSSRFVEEASFLRLKNVQIGYSLPASLLGKTKAMERARIFVSGTNLFTSTKWTGIDPENDFVPPLRQFMIGLNASF